MIRMMRKKFISADIVKFVYKSVSPLFTLAPMLILILAFTLPSVSEAQSTSGGNSRPWLMSRGASAREAKRFTLQEWLENKDRRALMDLWLNINTPSPYEFVLGGYQWRYENEVTTAGNTASANYESSGAEITAYASIVGLTAEYANNVREGFSDTTGIFNLRIFGSTVQGTHITLHYGLRTRSALDGSYRLNQQFPAATLQLYLMKYFGIQGNYRYYMPYSESFYGETKGDEINAGVFIEFGLLRLFGDWYQERLNSNLNSIETETKRTGTKVGLKFFF